MADQSDTDPDDNYTFDPADLSRTLLSIPLMNAVNRPDRSAPDAPIDIIIDANLDYPMGRQSARKAIIAFIRGLIGDHDGALVAQEGVAKNAEPALKGLKNKRSQQYVFARLSPDQIHALAQWDIRAGEPATIEAGPAPRRAIYKIWLDHKIKARTNKSVSTVKADAARTAFGTMGSDIVWAVLDTGVDGMHPHFATHGTLDLAKPLRHLDFTLDEEESRGGASSALSDKNGHGTHVAGIIAGEFVAGPKGRVLGKTPKAKTAGVVISEIKRFQQDESVVPETIESRTGAMGGMAPRAQILSLKVLDDDGEGEASNIIAALEYIQEVNGYGRHMVVHGANLSVGYGFEPAWFACGQSPVCVEVNRTVASGVVVVAAAGNTGYGYNQPMSSGPRVAGLNITINDPGNAEDAITVGSTHREMPHIYGVSYFSSKGPTGDGRLKPDLVAPGERILSCASGSKADAKPIADTVGRASVTYARYVEDSGTSMAAPHVSGVIAAFLSVRREFIGQPLKVKQIFMTTATDLGRERYFQGAGLVDLMRAIQSV